VKLEISKRARRQIEKIQAWWVAHRHDARGMFLEELAAAERQLRTTPELGSIYSTRRAWSVASCFRGRITTCTTGTAPIAMY
jgi:hypothetical protein